MLTGVSASLSLPESCAACVFTALLWLQRLALRDGRGLEPSPAALRAGELPDPLSPQQGSGPVKNIVSQCFEEQTRNTLEALQSFTKYPSLLNIIPELACCVACSLRSARSGMQGFRTAGRGSVLPASMHRHPHRALPVYSLLKLVQIYKP